MKSRDDDYLLRISDDREEQPFVCSGPEPKATDFCLTMLADDDCIGFVVTFHHAIINVGDQGGASGGVGGENDIRLESSSTALTLRKGFNTLVWGEGSAISHISQEGPGLPKFRVIFPTYPVKNLTLTATGNYNDCGHQIAYQGFNDKTVPPHFMRIYLPDQPPILFHESLMATGSQIHRFPALSTGKIGEKRRHWFMQLNEWRE